MVAIEEYRTRVQQLLEEYNSPQLPLQDEVETQLLIDTKHDHYQLIHVGWENGRRVYAPIIHIDIKGDKVWLQHNMTDQKIAEAFSRAGHSERSDRSRFSAAEADRVTR